MKLLVVWFESTFELMSEEIDVGSERTRGHRLRLEELLVKMTTT